MTTKTDRQAAMELRKVYIPATRGLITANEERMIRDVLEISSRSGIELDNIRDAVVTLYVRWAGSPKKSSSIPSIAGIMDALNSICCVIDRAKAERGLLL